MIANYLGPCAARQADDADVLRVGMKEADGIGPQHGVGFGEVGDQTAVESAAAVNDAVGVHGYDAAACFNDVGESDTGAVIGLVLQLLVDLGKERAGTACSWNPNREAHDGAGKSERK